MADKPTPKDGLPVDPAEETPPFEHYAGESPSLEDDTLPDPNARPQEEVQAEDLLIRLDTLGQSLASKRTMDINYRQSLGIEDEWMEDEEAYEGIDDANRATEGYRYRLRKPSTTSGTAAEVKTDPSRSTVFINITRPYTDAAAARVGDMLVPMDDRNFEIKPPNIPELTDAVNAGEKPSDMPLGMAGPEEPQAQVAQAAVGDNANAKADEVAQGAQQLAPAQSNVADIMANQAADPAELAKAAIEKAKKSAAKVQDQIDDWLTACQWHAESRKIIDDCSKVGTGVLKGPFPETKEVSVMKGDTLVVEVETKPASKRIDPWNFYPASGCGENIHAGDRCWERDDITRHTLSAMRNTEGAINSQIELCLTEGPRMAIAPDLNRTSSPLRDDTNYEIWYFHGFIGKEDLEAAGCDTSTMTGSAEFDTFPVMLTMVNERVIRAALNPLDNGKFPYDLIVWQKRAGMPWGMGVARQLRTCQRMLNAATRNMMENTGLSAGPQIVMMRDVISPADGSFTLTPRKLWYANPGAQIQEVQHAFMVVSIDCRQPELMAIVQFALKTAEDVTGIPSLLQGQMGQAPDTLGGMTMLNNNATAVLRRIARSFDDRIIEPHIARYYDWVKQYGDDPEMKLNFVIEARGSSVLVERDIENQSIVQMATMATQQAFGVDPRKYFRELCLAKRLDPARFQYDDATWKQIQEAMQKGHVDPRIAVAELNVRHNKEMGELANALEQQENARDRQLQMLLKEMDIAATSNLTGDQLKAKLSDTVLKLRTQVKLALRETTSPEVATPAVEPPKRAKPGEAFTH